MTPLVLDKVTTWIPDDWRYVTIPLFRHKELYYDSMYGTCFPLRYNDRLFLVTNHHILENEKPFLGIRQTNEKFMVLPHNILDEMGLEWIKHPSLDLVATPMPKPTLIDPHHWSIDEQYWNIDPELKINGDVLALGYPDGKFSSFADGSQGIFPIGMPGKISFWDDTWIKCSCNIQKGASGGPLFLKNNKGTAYLVGVVKGYGEGDDPKIGRCLRIKHVKIILDSTRMKKQIKDFEKRITEKNDSD